MGTIAFVGGTIVTMDPERERAEVMVVRGGRIAAIGDKSILSAYPGFEMVDLGSQVMLPAFIDSHMHLSFGCFLPQWASLQGLTQAKDVMEAMSRHATEQASGWIVGFPWTEPKGEGTVLTRTDLDRICPDRPVVLIHGTFHMLLVNTEAMKLAGLLGLDRRADSGLIIGADGEPTGVIMESAGAPILERALQFPTADYANLIEERSKALLQFGITSVQDPGVTPDAQKAYRLLHEQGRLPVSVLMMPHGSSLLDNDISACLEGPVTGCGDDMLRIGPIKLFADGGVSGSIANAGIINGRSFSSGTPRSDFSAPLMEATRRGFQVCVHSIGNVATDSVLDAFEAAAKEVPPGFKMRPRIEHMFTMSHRQIDRLAAMGGCASVQPFFLARVGEARRFCFEGFKWFPFRDLVRSGTMVCANSDDPGFGSFCAIDPLKGSLIGESMGDPSSTCYYSEQAMPFEQWLRMYTANAAFAGSLENERGMLKVGMVADMVVLSTIDPKQGPQVNETWKNGKKVYERARE